MCHDSTGLGSRRHRKFWRHASAMAARRTVRLRKEYLYKKSLEGRELQAYERKEKLKAALQGESPARALAASSPCYAQHA